MKKDELLKRAYAMPFDRPSYSRGPFKFVDREYLIITYRTKLDALREIVPEPLRITEPLVKFEFISMPDSAGFGDYSEAGQVIPVRYRGKGGGYVHSMYLDNDSPISGGREIWGFPKKYATPQLKVEKDVLLGTLKYGSVIIATGTMGYKYAEVAKEKVLISLKEPQFLIKIIPDTDLKLKVCQLVSYNLEKIKIKGAWTGPADLELHHHALAPIAQLPVIEVVSVLHFVADLTLGLGRVEYDYLKEKK